MSESNKTKLKEIAVKAMDGAKQRGVKDVRVSTYRGRKVSVVYRKGKADKVEESTTQSLNLHLYLDGKYTTCNTSDLREQALSSFLDSSVVLCKAMTPDKYRTITDPALYQGRSALDLGLFDPQIAEVTADARHQYAASLEEATLKAAGAKAISAEANYDDEESELYQIHSNGFEGYQRGTQFWSYAELALQDEGDKRPNGWAVAGSRNRTGLEDPAKLGNLAVDTALAKLGSGKIETQKMTMIVENRTVGRILGRLISALSGRALQQKATFLEEMIGKPFGSPMLSLTDEPFIVGAFGSRLYDAEGISAKQLPLFEKGVLRNFYIDTYYGNKLGQQPTTGGGSNIVVQPGTASLEDLVRNVDKGILVRGFIGGNSNTTTGDFSLGVYGTLIKKGQLGRAVSEMNIAANHKDFWKRLTAVGSDVYTYSTLRSPSLVFEDVQFSGS